MLNDSVMLSGMVDMYLVVFKRLNELLTWFVQVWKFSQNNRIQCRTIGKCCCESQSICHRFVVVSCFQPMP